MSVRKRESREETRTGERKTEKICELAYFAEHRISILLSADLILTFSAVAFPFHGSQSTVRLMIYQERCN